MSCIHPNKSLNISDITTYTPGTSNFDIGIDPTINQIQIKMIINLHFLIIHNILKMKIFRIVK